jgi:hypothetical protein
LAEANDPRNDTNQHEKFVSDISWIVHDFRAYYTKGLVKKMKSGHFPLGRVRRPRAQPGQGNQKEERI